MQSSLEEALKAPQLVPWRGWVSVSLIAGNSHLLRGPSGKWLMQPGERYEAEVAFSPVATGHSAEQRVEVGGSGPAADVDFTVFIDKDDGAVSGDPCQVRVPVGATAQALIALRTNRGEPLEVERLWLHVEQLGRTVALLPLDAGEAP